MSRDSVAKMCGTTESWYLVLTEWLGRRSEHESVVCCSFVGRWCKAPRSGQEIHERRGQGPKPVMVTLSLPSRSLSTLTQDHIPFGQNC
jgi:hypothetical protein